jgi:hypothetical protein
MTYRFKTGDTSPIKASYDWDGYTDGTNSPQPTANEKKIPMDRGDTFPPVRSCNKGAFWKTVTY